MQRKYPGVQGTCGRHCRHVAREAWHAFAADGMPIFILSLGKGDLFGENSKRPKEKSQS